MGNVKERSRHIISPEPAELKGFYFSSNSEAIDSAISILKEADGAKGIVYYDIDDTLLATERWIRWGLNRFFKNSDPDFKSVNLGNVQKSGGRYYQVPEYQEAAHQLGKTFSEIFLTIAKDPELHSYIQPHRWGLAM